MNHVSVARALVRTPWVHQGRSTAGLDCVGLLVLALRAAGVQLGDVTDYGRDPHGGLLERHLQREFGLPLCRRPTAGDLLPGDLAVLAFKGAPRHVAIVGDYIGGGLSLIHTYQSAATDGVTEHRLDGRWLHRIRAVWRVPAERFV